MDICKEFEYDKMYDLALDIMRNAHKGQFRRDGVTKYEVHPIELADMFDSHLDKIIAVLHDVIEDGLDQGVTEEYIREEFERAGFSGVNLMYVMYGLKYLTHDKEEDTYAEYIEKIAGTVYRKFKIADITINLADSPSDYQKMKYKKAMKILLGV